jgi:hypothetical protein
MESNKLTMILICTFVFLFAILIVAILTQSKDNGKCNKYVYDNSSEIICPVGTFSNNGSGHVPCTKCTDCTDLGGEKTKCIAKRDAVCNESVETPLIGSRYTPSSNVQDIINNYQ